MNTVVVTKMVPDLVEELEIDPGGTALDTTWLRFVLNEVDEHALEQALLLKEAVGGHVTVVSLDGDGVDDVLFSASAKGADRIVKLTGSAGDEPINNHALARIYAAAVAHLEPSLVLTGVQAHDDLDGSLGPLLAGELGLPYVGYVAGVVLDDGACLVKKEYPGGVKAEMHVDLPAVLGVQAADQPPRYVAVSRVRQARTTASLEELDAGAVDPTGGPVVGSLLEPATGERAEMLEGDEDEVADGIIEILRERGVL